MARERSIQKKRKGHREDQYFKIIFSLCKFNRNFIRSLLVRGYEQTNIN